MKNNAFSAGVKPGGLKNRQEIKILICFIMYKMNRSFKKNDITAILQVDGLANYFEISQAFSEMVVNNAIVPDNNGDGYRITSSGKMIVEELKTLIPISVREKALKNTNDYIKRIKTEQENKVSIQKNEHGYNVTCKISDGKFNMLELKLYAPDILAASNIKNNFYKDPQALYQNILSILMDDETKNI